MANVPKKKKESSKKAGEQPEKQDSKEEAEKDEAFAETASDGRKTAQKRSKAQRFNQFLELSAEGNAVANEEGDSSAEPRGVIYLGHIPKGFYEPQMRTFFSQFGKIIRMRISRSKRNAQSKGYAFLEFAEESVAKIVADTMDKYLLFGKQLVCHLVPKDKQHPALFKNCKRKMVNFTKSRQRKAREALNNRPAVEVDGAQIPQTTIRQAARRAKAEKKLGSLLQRLEIDFDFDEAGPKASARGVEERDGSSSTVAKTAAEPAELERTTKKKMRAKAEGASEAEAPAEAAIEVVKNASGGAMAAARDGAGVKPPPKKRRKA